MIPTVFGIVIAGIGLVLLVRAQVPAMYVFVLVCSLMGGSAALQLPALGGSSIPPVQFALGFLILRLLLPGSGAGELVKQGIRANGLLVAYALYGVTMAFVGPRIFAGRIMVVPMKVTAVYMFAVFKLVPSSQNITASVYMIGTMMLAVASYAACRHERGGRALVKTGVVLCWIHIFFGVSGVVLSGTPWSDVLDFFRNGSYAQLDQRIGTVVRMNGIHPEPSSFAGFGYVWFLFMAECWYRDVSSKATGWAAFAMGLTLAASTSSTAYLGLGAYFLILGLRVVFVPDNIPSPKLVRLGMVALALAVLVCLIFLLQPGLVATASDVFTSMTVGKKDSDSALQRSFWAKQGVNAFAASMGLGIGPGSFRSSSLPTAVIGATGLFGAIMLLLYVLHVLKPWRASTYNRVRTTTDASGVAAAWTAVCMLIPASFVSPTSDPGGDFAIFAGAALALRLPAGRKRLFRPEAARADHVRRSVVPA
ncbi:O-antigen ligase family protein [uncultured Sphingomonas sp.]|uniref:O-antigen ligase family protein n=1 Tax=uncultured Sphingomonas sp. TaxID=158754 RepID=UPI0025E75397|nr:O-antigen ligase family protein [uncultured Sphingomonas sp.]